MATKTIFKERSPEERANHVASKTMYLNKSTYADVQFTKRLVTSIAESMKLDVEAIKKNI